MLCECGCDVCVFCIGVDVGVGMWVSDGGFGCCVNVGVVYVFSVLMLMCAWMCLSECQGGYYVDLGLIAVLMWMW